MPLLSGYTLMPLSMAHRPSREATAPQVPLRCGSVDARRCGRTGAGLRRRAAAAAAAGAGPARAAAGAGGRQPAAACAAARQEATRARYASAGGRGRDTGGSRRYVFRGAHSACC